MNDEDHDEVICEVHEVCVVCSSEDHSTCTSPLADERYGYRPVFTAAPCNVCGGTKYHAEWHKEVSNG